MYVTKSKNRTKKTWDKNEHLSRYLIDGEFEEVSKLREIMCLW